uniref:Adipocyte plasma membrane-associated protein n=1 Tax=Oryctolagus cuniculus TaxID=9986 RepID=A0A5F9D4Z4_RABIT
MSEADGLRQRRPLRPQVVTDDGQAPEAKDGSSFSGRVFRVTFLMLAVSLTVPLLGAVMLLDSPIDPQPLSFKEPPFLLGVLQPNTKLRQVERLFENQLIGPESIANIGDVMFTGTADGRVVKLENGEIETIARFGSGPCSEVKLLLSSDTPIEGKKMSFVNDLTITRDGRKIYFTDSSSKWQRRDYLLLVMEGTDDGRLLEYDTVTKEVKVLLDQLRFPNGIQLSPAEDFVLVAETTMARIRRVYVSGLMKGGADLFVENMPGFPDNIRPSSAGGYWVAMSSIRPSPGFSMLDFLAERPYIKKMIFKVTIQNSFQNTNEKEANYDLSLTFIFQRSLVLPKLCVTSNGFLKHILVRILKGRLKHRNPLIIKCSGSLFLDTCVVSLTMLALVSLPAGQSPPPSAMALGPCAPLQTCDFVLHLPLPLCHTHLPPFLWPHPEATSLSLIPLPPQPPVSLPSPGDLLPQPDT